MSQQRQTQRETGDSNDETEELQRSLMENGRKAMRQFVELPLQQSLQFQRSAAELFVNGLEAQKWAQERGIELTKNTMGNYLQTLDNVTQNAEELARTEIAAGQQQGQAIQQATRQFQSAGEMQRQPSGGQQQTSQQPPEVGQQASTGGFQQPQGPQPQEIGQQQPQAQGLGQQPPQSQMNQPQPQPQPRGIGQGQPPQIQGLQQPLGQQPSSQVQPAPQATPEPTEATQQGSREGQQTDGQTQTESPAETQ